MTTTTYATKGRYLFTVPAQCTSITVVAKGAGGGGHDEDGNYLGGKGGLAQGTYVVTPGETLWIYVGGGGNTSAGFNGGGAAGTSSNGVPGNPGGGASDVRRGVDDLAHRIVVAAGGGGSAGAFAGGALGGQGGAATGAAGANGLGSTGGAGGTAAAGGARGTPGGTAADNATAGASGVGGNGSTHTSIDYSAGGGGGGGYFGGGGGGGGDASHAAAGGGGGSNYVGAGTATTTTRGAGSGQNGTNLNGADGSIALTYNVAPNQPALLSPVGNQPADLTAAIRATWQFSDPDPGDTQSKADVQWRVGSGAWTVIANASASAVAHYDFAANLFTTYAGQSIEWQVRTYDALSAQGPWSASGFFKPVNPPTAPVYSPAPVINSNAPAVVFTTPSGSIGHGIELWSDVAGAPGVLLLGGALEADTGNPTTVTDTIGPYAFVNGTSYHVRSRYQHDSGVWSAYVDSGAIVANINAPLQPAVVVTEVPDTGSVRVDVTNPGSDPFPPAHNDVYRTDLLTGEELRIATGVTTSGSFTDYRPPFNRQVRYRVVAVTGSGAFTSSA